MVYINNYINIKRLKELTESRKKIGTILSSFKFEKSYIWKYVENLRFYPSWLFTNLKQRLNFNFSILNSPVQIAISI